MGPIPLGGLGSVHLSLKTNRWVRSKLALSHRWPGEFCSPNVNAFPDEVEFVSAPSVSNVFEKVYEARNCRPWLSRFVRLASRPLYQELPSDSISSKESAGMPRIGTRKGMFATVLLV